MKRSVGYLFLSVLVSFVLLQDCQREEISTRDFPRVITMEVTKISAEGATFTAEILFKGDNIIKEYGFVWDSLGEPVYEYAEKASSEQDAGAGKYSFTITTLLNEKTTYYVKAYLKTDPYTVYGNKVSFRSLGSGAPSITDIYPTTGKIFDTVTIHGKGFSEGLSNVVLFDTCVATVLHATGSHLMVRVPELLHKENNSVTVSIFGNAARAPQEFKLLQPVLAEYDPKTGTFGDTVRLAVQNFPRLTEAISIKFGTCSASVIEATDEQITCIVPAGIPLPDPVVSVCFGKREQAFPDNFHLLPPEIHSFTPAEADNAGITVTLTGNNFNPVPAFNTVCFRDKKSEVIHAERHELQVLVPDELIGPPDVTVIDTLRISVETAGQKTVSSSVFSFRYLSRWTKMADFPGAPRIIPVTCSIGGKAFLGLGSCCVNEQDYSISGHYKDFWEYDPQTGTWKRKADFPGSARGVTASFVIGDKLYVCGGITGSQYDGSLLKEVWEYDPLNDAWTRKSDVPGTFRFSSFGFALNDKGYVGGATVSPPSGDGTYDYYSIKDLLEYDAGTDTWKRKNVVPFFAEFTKGFNIGSYGYIYYGYDIYDKEFRKFNPELNNWSWEREMPAAYLHVAGFVIGDDLYLGTGIPNMLEWHGTTDFYRYNAVTGVWYSLGFGGPKRLGAGGFSVAGKGYICGGMSESHEANLSDLWMFDPTK